MVRSRRNFLCGAGAAGMVGLAGCIGDILGGGTDVKVEAVSSDGEIEYPDEFDREADAERNHIVDYDSGIHFEIAANGPTGVDVSRDLSTERPAVWIAPYETETDEGDSAFEFHVYASEDLVDRAENWYTFVRETDGVEESTEIVTMLWEAYADEIRELEEEDPEQLERFEDEEFLSQIDPDDIGEVPLETLIDEAEEGENGVDSVAEEFEWDEIEHDEVVVQSGLFEAAADVDLVPTLYASAHPVREDLQPGLFTIEVQMNELPDPELDYEMRHDGFKISNEDDEPFDLDHLYATFDDEDPVALGNGPLDPEESVSRDWNDVNQHDEFVLFWAPEIEDLELEYELLSLSIEG